MEEDSITILVDCPLPGPALVVIATTSVLVELIQNVSVQVRSSLLANAHYLAGVLRA
jgi:hypothetical protein